MERIKRLSNTRLPEFLLFGFAFFTRFFRLGTPSNFMFDEVYHAFTAQEMVKGNPAAWEWWNTPPAGMAYEWTHPPLAKLFMFVGIEALGQNAWGWRVFPALFGFGIIVLIYFIALKLFRNRLAALLATFVAATDGLLLVMSRIAMNDSFLVFFSLAALLAFLYNRKLLMSLCLGLAVASKWTGMYAIGILGILYLAQLILDIKTKQANLRQLAIRLLTIPIWFLAIPAAIYLASYIPFFLGHHSPPDQHWNNWQTFVELQKQMWWYHTNLKAHHDYQSTPIEWVLNIRPVWFYVDYKDMTIANVYALGNPLGMWFGLIAILFVLWDFLRKRTISLLTVLVGYFGFFLPWVGSPRIMFFYHYTPAVPFLALAAGYVLEEFCQDSVGKWFVAVFCAILLGIFIFFFPLWTAIHIPKCQEFQHCFAYYDSLFWFKSWK